jgi:hypothetical protein
VFTGTNLGKLSIVALTTSKEKTYSITVTQTIIDANSKLYKTSAAANGTPAANVTTTKTLNLSIIVENACKTTALSLVTVTTAKDGINTSISINDGSIYTVAFTDAKS